MLVTTLLAAGVGITLSSETLSYAARSTIYVGSLPNAADISSDRLAAIDRIVLTFSKMIDSVPVAAEAVEALNLDVDPEDVVQATEVSPEPATQLLYIEVTDRDPSVAQSLSNALAEAFVETVQEFEPGDPESTVPRFPAKVYERATLPVEPEPTDQIRTILLATLFGLVAGVALVFLLDYLDVSLRTAADVERKLELPVLGVIPALGAEAPFGGRPPPATERRKGAG